MRLITIAIGLFGASILFTGCAPLKQYRTTFEGPPCKITSNEVRQLCKKRAFYKIVGNVSEPALKLIEERRGKESAEAAEVAIFEFDDLGHAINESHYQKTIGALRNALESAEGSLVVVFAHGWKHSADFRDSNLIDFEKMLLDIKAIDRLACGSGPCRDRKVIGVFLAWRGLSAKLQPFRELSFYNRKKRAHSVGSQGGARLIADLRELQSEHSQTHLNRLVLVGHSFGGAIIFNAVQQQLLSDLAGMNEDGTIDRNVANAVILVNPAFEAAQFSTLFEASSKSRFRGRHRIALASFTSTGDSATKRWFPLGRFFSTLFAKYIDQEQKSSNRRAVGHFDNYVTHTLTTQSESARSSLASSVRSWERFQNGCASEFQVGKALFRRTREVARAQVANPFLNVIVDESLIEDHNRIWGRGFARFLYTLIAVQEATRLPNGCFPVGMCNQQSCDSGGINWSCRLLDRRDKLAKGEITPSSDEDRVILNQWCE